VTSTCNSASVNMSGSNDKVHTSAGANWNHL